MKKILSLLICLLLSSGIVYAKESPNKLRIGINQYKIGNYLGCIDTMKQLATKDPGNAVAHYYLGMAYARAGMKDLASKEYNSVTILVPQSKLAYYASLGLKYLETANTPVNGSNNTQPGLSLPVLPEIKIPAIDFKPGVPNENFMSDKAKNALMEQRLNQTINKVNTNNPVKPQDLQKLQDFSEKKSDNSTPSSDEIAQALQTLSKAGLNQNQNSEALQMNMLMASMGGGMNNSGNSGFNPMSMLPFMMMSQNSGNGTNKNIDPQVMQTMLTNMMMPNMSLMNSNSNNNYE